MIWLPRGNANKFHAQTIRKKKGEVLFHYCTVNQSKCYEELFIIFSDEFLMCHASANSTDDLLLPQWLAAEWLFWQNNNETLKETYNRRLLLSPLNTFLEVNWPIVVLSYGFAHSHCNILLSSQYIQYKCHIGRTIYHHWFDMPFAALIFYSCR